MRSTIEANIARTGQHLVAVFDPEGHEDNFTYSIGNAINGLPELLLIGNFPMQLAEMALNAVAEHQRNNGKPLDEGFLDIEWSFPFKIRKTSEAAKSGYTIQAGSYLGREDYDVLQVMICDKNGKYPGDEGCAPGFNVAQP